MEAIGQLRLHQQLPSLPGEIALQSAAGNHLLAGQRRGRQADLTGLSPSSFARIRGPAGVNRRESYSSGDKSSGEDNLRFRVEFMAYQFKERERESQFCLPPCPNPKQKFHLLLLNNVPVPHLHYSAHKNQGTEPILAQFWLASSFPSAILDSSVAQPQLCCRTVKKF